jgi:uncharacterized membrane protein
MLSHAADRAAGELVVEGSQRYRVAYWMWAIVAVGAALRLIALGHKSFWIDEIASVAIARRTAPAFWHFLWHDEGNMAAYYMLLRPWLAFGYGEGVVRLLSVIPGVLSIPAMYGLGRRLFGRETGVLAAALLALNPCAIAVSQEARAYSFVLLAVLLSTYLFVRLMEEPSYGLACGYALVAGLTCYFHYFGVLVPAAHAISLAAVPRGRRPWRQLSLAAVIIVVMAAPILWLIHAQDVGHISWVQPPSLLEFYHLGVFLAANGGKAVGAVLLVLDLVLVGLFVAAFRRVSRDSGSDAQLWRYGLPVSMVLPPIVITLLVSMVRPAFYHRFLIICLPGFVLMTAVGLREIHGVAWRRCALAAVCILSAVSTVIVYRRVIEDWRGVVRYLISHSHREDRVLYYQSVGEFAGESYRDWLAAGERPLAIGVNPADDSWKTQVDGAPRVWLVLYRAKVDDDGSRVVERELMKRYQTGGVTSFPGVTLVEFVLR